MKLLKNLVFMALVLILQVKLKKLGSPKLQKQTNIIFFYICNGPFASV